MSQWLPNFFVLDQTCPCQACLTIAAASLYWSATELLLCLRCLATFLSIFWIQVCGPSSAVCTVLCWQRNLEIASCCYILPYTASDHNWCMMMQINCCLRLATLLKQNLFHLCIESQTEREGITIRSQVLEPWAYLFLFVRGSDSKYLPDFCIFLLGLSLLVPIIAPSSKYANAMSRAVGEGDGGYSLQISDRK